MHIESVLYDSKLLPDEYQKVIHTYVLQLDFTVQYILIKKLEFPRNFQYTGSSKRTRIFTNLNDTNVTK